MPHRFLPARGATAEPPVPSRERAILMALVLLGLALRLPHLDQGLVEVHSWRQADGAMIARNLLDDGFDVLHPRVDWAGDQPGYVGTELPLVPLLTSLLWALFGERLLFGRLVALAFFPPACWMLWRLARNDFGPRAAAIALFAFVVSPLGIHYSRALLPDGPMLWAQLAALAYAARWARSGRERDRWLAVSAAALAMLIKLPAGVVLLPMAALALEREGWSFLRSPRYWLALAVALAPAAIWYAHAAALARAHEPNHFFGEENWLWSTGTGVLLEPRLWFRIGQRAAALVVGPLGLLAALAGVVALARHRARRLYVAWGAGLTIAILAGWQAHVRHEYYQLPLVPLAAILAGLGVERFALAPVGARSSRTRRTLLGTAAALQLATGIALAEARSFSDRAWRLSTVGRWVGERTPSGDLVVAADGGDPTLLWASGRRGWHFPDAKPQQKRAPWDLERIESLRTRGAAWFVALRSPLVDPNAAPALHRAVVRWLPAEITDRLPASITIDAHPALARQLEARWPIAAESAHAVIYDLRDPTDPRR